MYKDIQITRKIYESEEHQMVAEALDALLGVEALPHYEQWEKEGMVPHSFWEKLGEQGFLCMDVEEQFGGAGLDFSFCALVQERIRLAGVDFGLAVHSDIVAPYISAYGNDVQKQRYLPKMVSGEWIGCIGMTEPGAGSDLKALKTAAVEDGDHFIVNGSKTFITNGYVADFVLCAVRTYPGTDREGISLLLMDKTMDGFTTGQPFEKLGAKAQDTCELFFEDVRVPKANVLGEEGEGFKIMMTELARERLGIAIEAVASAQLALESTIQYTVERKAFKKSIAEFQNTQFKLADLASELQVYQCFLDSCISLQAVHQLTPIQASMAKLKATEMYGKMVDECLQLFGGYGFIWEYPIARNFAAARVTRLYGGTSEIMKLIISRGLLKRHLNRE